MKGDAGLRKDIEDCHICNVNTLAPHRARPLLLKHGTGTHQTAGTCSHWLRRRGGPEQAGYEDALSCKTQQRVPVSAVLGTALPAPSFSVCDRTTHTTRMGLTEKV